MEQIKENDEHHQPFNFGLNHHHIVSSSSSSAASCHIFFNPTQDHDHGHAAFYHPQLYHHHPQDDYYEGGRSSYEIEKKVENGLKLTLWKKEDIDEGPDDGVKWKKTKKREDEEVKARCWSSDLSSNSNSSLSLSYNCSNTPIRVCSDCHTTKTPLWRSGPKGPKSLCNACGIRQRKARRAVAAAAAAAAANGGGVAAAASSNPMKVKEKMKKRSKVSGGGGSSLSTSTKKNKNIGSFEELLINLSNKLALIQRVFPQDEKEAAILLMALSSGLLHG